MIKEEIWSIPLHRAAAFFREQPDVTEESTCVYRFCSCRITLTELEPSGTGFWAAKRIKIHIEGENADVERIYHRYFMQFLSAGG